MVHRVLAGVSAVALVACLLVVGWHKATVVHAVCVEHGDELHLSKVAEHAHETDDPTSRAERSAWELGEGDHHCTILATSRDAAPVAHDATIAVDVALDDSAPLPVADVVRTSLALYRLAPKTSPPV